MQIIVLEPIHTQALNRLKQYADVIDWQDERKNDWSKASAVIVRANTITKQQIALAPNLKVIGKHGIGVNSIDIQAAKEKNIAVVYTPTGFVAQIEFRPIISLCP